MAFYQKIKDLRISLSLTQFDMAGKLNISQQAYSDYEAGISEPTLTNLKKIADIFEVSTDYLLDRADDYALLWQPYSEKQ